MLVTDPVTTGANFQLTFVLWITRLTYILFIIFMPISLRLFFGLNNEFLGRLLLDYLNIAYPVFFSVVYFLVTIFINRSIVYHRYKYDVFLFSVLYGQIAFLFFLLIITNYTYHRIALLIIAVFSLYLSYYKPSSKVFCFFSIFYFFASFIGYCDFILRKYFFELSMNHQVIFFWLVIPTLWAITAFLFLITTTTNHRLSNRNPRFFKKSFAFEVVNLSGFSLFLTIVSFSVIYYNIAHYSKGHAFQYSEKAILDQWARKFREEFPNIPFSLCKKLSQEYRYTIGNNGIIIGQSRDPFSGIETYIVIPKNFNDIESWKLSPAWAHFYQASFESQGYTHFRISKYTGITGPNTVSNVYRLLLYILNDTKIKSDKNSFESMLQTIPYDRIVHGKELKEYIVYLSNELEYDEKQYMNNFGLKMNHKESGVLLPNIYPEMLFNIENLPTYLEHANNYLDDSISKIYDILAINYLNSYRHYFYYSVVTLSTTGYGDITPVEPVLQTFTTIEIILGWGLLIIFGSYIINKLKRISY